MEPKLIEQLVKQQYERWVYPKPVTDLEDSTKSGQYQLVDPHLYWPLYWPAREPSPIDILVAGCGTSQAAELAYSNRTSRVVGIDISESSLELTRKLKARHHLDNLEIHQLSIVDVSQLEREFDLIVSTGVLHHLPDPVAGGKALADILNADGVMSLMLYGRAGRTGVYLLQEAFGALQLGQTEDDVALVREILDELPDQHPVRRYVRNTPELSYPGAIVDTFLHPQDRAYSVQGVYEFAERVGLEFQAWLDSGIYSPRLFLRPGHHLYRKITALPVRQQAIVTDNLWSCSSVHRFLLCQKNRPAASYRIVFDSTAMTRLVPARRSPLRVTQQPDWDKSVPLKLQRWNEGGEMTLGQVAALLVEAANGERTIEDCRAFAQQHGPASGPVSEHDVLDFYQRMHDWGHLMFTVKAL